MEKSEEKKPETTASKTGSAKTAYLAGKEEKKSAWEIGLETIVGDNKLLSTVLKVVLSPIGLVVVLCGIGYLLYKNINYKKENEKLSEENKRLLEEHKDLKTDLDKWHEKYLVSKSRKIVDYEDEDMNGHGFAQGHRSPFGRESNRKKQQTFYLD